MIICPALSLPLWLHRGGEIDGPVRSDRSAVPAPVKIAHIRALLRWARRPSGLACIGRPNRCMRRAADDIVCTARDASALGTARMGASKGNPAAATRDKEGCPITGATALLDRIEPDRLSRAPCEAERERQCRADDIGGLTADPKTHRDHSATTSLPPPPVWSARSNGAGKDAAGQRIGVRRASGAHGSASQIRARRCAQGRRRVKFFSPTNPSSYQSSDRTGIDIMRNATVPVR